MLKRASEAAHKNEIYIADRSPFSACYYASNGVWQAALFPYLCSAMSHNTLCVFPGHLLKDVIAEQMNEVREGADIHIYTVHVRVERERLWDRICQRLRREPHRAKYNEDKRQWMEDTVEFYDNFGWDMSVDNNDISLVDLMHQIVRDLSEHSTQFQEAVFVNSESLLPETVAAASPIALPSSGDKDGKPVGFHSGADIVDFGARRIVALPPGLEDRHADVAGSGAGGDVPTTPIMPTKRLGNPLSDVSKASEPDDALMTP